MKQLILSLIIILVIATVCNAQSKAQVTGTITDCTSGAPLENVAITAGSSNPVYTDAEGNYTLNISNGMYDLVMEKEEYISLLIDNINLTGLITMDTCIQEDIYIPPNLEIYPEEYIIYRSWGTVTKTAILTNSGGDTLEWESSISSLETKNNWIFDLVYEKNLTELTGGENSFYGIAAIGETFYLSVEGTDIICEYDTSGVILAYHELNINAEVLSLTVVNGFLYAGFSNNKVYSIDPSDFSVYESFTAPTTPQYISYHPLTGNIFICSENSNFYMTDTEGVVIEEYENPFPERILGIEANADFSNNSDYYIFVFAEINNEIQICMYYPDDQGYILWDSFTGIFPNISNLTSIDLFNWNPEYYGEYSFMGIANSDEDIIFGLEYFSIPAWATLSENNGILVPGESKEIEIVFDVDMLIPWYHYEADIYFYTTPDVGIDSIHVIFPTSGNKTLKTNALDIYPNPVSSDLTISITKTYRYTILNTLGKTVLEKEIYPNENTINVEALPPGIYILKLEDENHQVSVGKFVKQ